MADKASDKSTSQQEHQTKAKTYPKGGGTEGYGVTRPGRPAPHPDGYIER